MTPTIGCHSTIDRAGMGQARDATDHQNGEDHGTANQQPERNLSASDFIHDMGPGNGKGKKARIIGPLPGAPKAMRLRPTAAATTLQCRCLLALPTIMGFPVLDVNQINCLPPAGILRPIVPEGPRNSGFSATCHAPKRQSVMEETKMADNNDDDIPFMQKTAGQPLPASLPRRGITGAALHPVGHHRHHEYAGRQVSQSATSGRDKYECNSAAV
jgi:hypothetical protein